MPFSSDEEDLPDLLQFHAFHQNSSNLMENQVKRLEKLEDELRVLKKDIQTAALSKFTQSSSNTKILTHDTSSTEPSDMHGTSEESKTTECTEEVDKAMRNQEVQYELRMLVPHLSPEFDCSFQDAVLLITAVRNGYAEKGQDSLMDRINILEAEKRSLAQRLTKKSNECEDLRYHLRGVQERIQAIKEAERNKNTILSKRREEIRKQLLIEEGKVQKLNVRYKKLEVEHEELKSRIRAGLR